MVKFCVYVTPRTRDSSKLCWYFLEEIFVCNFHLVFFQKQCRNTLVVEI